MEAMYIVMALNGTLSFVQWLCTEVVHDSRFADVARHVIAGCIPISQWGLEIARLCVSLWFCSLPEGIPRLTRSDHYEYGRGASGYHYKVCSFPGGIPKLIGSDHYEYGRRASGYHYKVCSLP